MSVPNQKVLIITKPQTTTPPFLQISADDWQTAFKELSPSAFGVYLHLAQNADGYKYEYSPTAIENTGIMSKGTATKARQELEKKGYIDEGRFYVETPAKRKLREQVQQEINRVAGA